MGTRLTWAHLIPGDVLLNSEDFPIIVVLQCSESDNKFVWMHLTGVSAGKAVDCNLHGVGMWYEPLVKTYRAILRGNDRIET